MAEALKKVECGSEECHAPAVAEVFWPGKPAIPMCNVCVARARQVAMLLGFFVEVRPLPGSREITVPKA